MGQVPIELLRVCHCLTALSRVTQRFRRGLLAFITTNSIVQGVDSIGRRNTLTTEVLRRPVELTQYVSIVYNERLAEHKIVASTGTVGDSYDNALAENVNGSYKNEIIDNRTWNDVVDVEIATFEWVT